VELDEFYAISGKQASRSKLLIVGLLPAIAWKLPINVVASFARHCVADDAY
jgi:hypothetical protein